MTGLGGWLFTVLLGLFAGGVWAMLVLFRLRNRHRVWLRSQFIAVWVVTSVSLTGLAVIAIRG